MGDKKVFSRFLPAALALILAASVLCGCGKTKRHTQETEATTFGIDVARYQGTIDWPQVAESGIDFAIVRVGYRGREDGVITEDVNARYNLQEVSRAGISMGAYFFSTALTEEEAREEAAWVADIISAYPITYPVAYDCEGFNDPDSRQYSMSKEERTNVALAFLEEIEDLGYEGMFYASKVDMEFENNWDTSKIEERYKIWVAQYPAEPYPQTRQSSYSGEHQVWQYSMEGSIPGITQNVDLNIAYFGYDGIEPAKNKKTPEEAFPDVEAMMDFEEVSEQVTAKEETNLRDIPSQGTDSQILLTLNNGEVAQRIAVSSSGWSKLLYKEQIYYAVSSYLTTDLKYGYETDIVISAEADETEVQTIFRETNQPVTAKDTVNLRSLPSVEHESVEVIAQLKNGDVATCVGVSDNGWSKLLYRGTTCYAISSYLQSMEQSSVSPSVNHDDFDITFSDVNETVTAVDKVNLRSIPSTEREDSVIITQLLNGAYANRVGISKNGWSKLIYNGTTCYAATRYLVVADSAAIQSEVKNEDVQTQFQPINDQVTAKDAVNLRTLPSVEDPDCEVVAKLKNGEIVTRTGINRDLGWSRVEYQGRTLYCISSYLEETE